MNKATPPEDRDRDNLVKQNGAIIQMRAVGAKGSPHLWESMYRTVSKYEGKSKTCHSLIIRSQRGAPRTEDGAEVMAGE